MNNKQLGDEWEKGACDILKERGYWVHFIEPNKAGAQPFDIIAVKNGKAIAIDCKTLAESKKYFSLDRLEENQKYAFNRWLDCGNGEPLIWIKQGDSKRFVEYTYLLKQAKVLFNSLKEI